MRKDTEMIRGKQVNKVRKKTCDINQKEISERDLKNLAEGVGVQVRKQTLELKVLRITRLKAAIEQAHKNFKASGLKHA